MNMLFSNKINVVKRVTLDETLAPSSFPGLLLLIDSPTFKEKYKKGSAKINWTRLCEQMILHATLSLVSNKYIQIELIESEDQYFFKTIKFNNSSFKVSIPANVVSDIKIPDRLSNELYGCSYLLSNRNEDKKVSLERVIELLCKRNSNIYEDPNPHKTFVTSILGKYENFNWINQTNEKKYRTFNNKGKIMDQSKQNELRTELDIFSNHIDKIEEQIIVNLIKTLKDLTQKHL